QAAEERGHELEPRRKQQQRAITGFSVALELGGDRGRAALELAERERDGLAGDLTGDEVAQPDLVGLRCRAFADDVYKGLAAYDLHRCVILSAWWCPTRSTVFAITSARSSLARSRHTPSAGRASAPCRARFTPPPVPLACSV